jgi:uncharacterized protein (DUF2267 family)
MNGVEFVQSVRRRTGLPSEAAEMLTHATLRVLAERLSGGEAEDLQAQLPKELKEDLAVPKQKQAESFGAAEFTRRVAERAGIDETAAQIGAAAVLATIGDAVTRGEFDDVLSQLGREFAALIGTANAAAGDAVASGSAAADPLRQVIMMPVAVTRTVVEDVMFTARRPDALLYLGGLAALAALGVLEWPVAAAAGIGLAVAGGARNAPGRRQH